MMDRILNHEEALVWYMDDMLIYRQTTEAEQQAFVDNVLQQCVKHRLVVNLTKSEFYVHETIFLGQIDNGSQVQMDAANFENMYKWPVPTEKKEGQPF